MNSLFRAIYEELTDDDLSISGWDTLNKDIISLGFNVWRTVCPVVASDSPEGHLPMDRTPAANSTEVTPSEETGFDLYCAVLDPVVVSDVFPDEIVRDILDQILEETTGGGDGELRRRQDVEGVRSLFAQVQGPVILRPRCPAYNIARAMKI
jgi:hypothetical protein